MEVGLNSGAVDAATATPSSLLVEGWPNFVEQVVVLMQRQVKQSRGKLLKKPEMLLNVFVGIISGVIWWQAGAEQRMRDVEGALFFFVAHMSWWPLFLYLFSFPAERSVLAKEQRSKSYSIEAYLLGKTLAEIPQEMVCPSIYFAVCLPMIGFSPGPATVLWLVLLLHYQSSASIGTLVSVLTGGDYAGLWASTVMTLQMCAGGYLVDVSSLPPLFAWLPYISIWYYTGAVIFEAGVDELSDKFSQLSMIANILIVAAFTLALKFAVYLALKFSRHLEFV